MATAEKVLSLSPPLGSNFAGEDFMVTDNTMTIMDYPSFGSSNLLDNELRTPSPLDDCQIDSASDLISVVLPTNKIRTLKRKHIRTVDDARLSSVAQEAQKQEKERLERLKKFQENVRENSSPTVSSIPSPNETISAASCTKKPSEVDVIELSSDEEEVKDVSIIGPTALVLPGAPEPKRKSEMEVLQLQEKRRLRKRRESADLENTELNEGRLLVNAGKPSGDPDVYVPAHLTSILQPHQLGGIRFMYDNIIESIGAFPSSPGFGCILAHSMGLGKTLQVITFTDIFYRFTGAKKILIIVPINTIQNWRNEYDKWLPELLGEDCRCIRPFRVYLLGDAVKTVEERGEMIKQWHTEGGVLLIGYDMFRMLVQVNPGKKKPVKKVLKKPKDEIVDLVKEVDSVVYSEIRNALLDPGPDLIICDEGHRIKNDKAGITAALAAVKTKRRIVLTGYPLQNNLMEYYCMVDFVRPSYLGSKKDFSVMFDKPIKNGLCIDSTPGDIKLAKQRTHVLVELLKGFVQRRTHHLLKKILPPSSEFVLLLRKSPIQRLLYRSFVQFASTEINSTHGTSTFNPLKAFAACSKIWNHPDVLHNVLKKIENLSSSKSQRSYAFESSQIDSQQSGPSTSQNCIQYQDPSTYGAYGSDSSVLYGNYNGHSFPYSAPPQQFTGQYFTECNEPSAFVPNHFNSPEVARYPQYHDPSLPFSPELSLPSTLLSHNIPLNAADVGKAKFDDSRKNMRNRFHTTIAKAILEEMGLNSGVKYEWAELAMLNYQPGIIENGYKMVIALSLIKEATRNHEKILLFSQSLLTLDLIELYLQKSELIDTSRGLLQWKKNVTYYRFDGSTPGSEREKLINRFNEEPSALLFLISTRAGSLGINLVAANRVIIFDASWNPCYDAQAVCRIYRYGQRKRTFIYRLVVDNSMERAIFNRQIGKSGLQQRVVDDKQMDVDVTKRELEQLLVYDEAHDVTNPDLDMTSWHCEDPVLWLTVVSHRNMFSQLPFLHESMLMEREEGLSPEEKLEAQILYEREKNLYKGIDFDRDIKMGRWMRERELVQATRSDERLMHQEFYSPPMLPIAATPLPMRLERIGTNKGVSSQSHVPISTSVEIMTERDMLLPCVTERNVKRILKPQRCWLIHSPSGVFLRTMDGALFDARGTIYVQDRRFTLSLPAQRNDVLNSKTLQEEVICLSDSD